MCCLQPKFDIIIKRTCKCSNLGGELLRIAALFCAGFFYCDINNNKKAFCKTEGFFICKQKMV